MVAGVPRSEVWLSVHVPEPNYSLISTQVAPTVHSHTHTHTYTCYSHYSLISAVTYSGQANKTVHRSLIVITIYLPLITRLLFVCLNMDIKCLMIFFEYINIYSSDLSLWYTITISNGRTWLFSLICGQHICTIIKVTRWKAAWNDSERKGKRGVCIINTYFTNPLYSCGSVSSPRMEKKRYKIHNLSSQWEEMSERKEKLLFPPTSKHFHQLP